MPGPTTSRTHGHRLVHAPGHRTAPRSANRVAASMGRDVLTRQGLRAASSPVGGEAKTLERPTAPGRRFRVDRSKGTIVNPRETGARLKASWNAATTTSRAALETISERGKAQMRRLLDVARRSAAGKRPGGWCYRAVKKYLRTVGYGGLNAATVSQLPQRAARQFGDFMNRGDNARRYGLQKLPISNPYLAPPGSLVVVRPGTPGTRHPWAGDITVAVGNGRFYNDGNMGYGGSKNFPRGNRHVIGIYAPV
ncbi:MAG: hypothetical protein FJY99_07015 [Candidatus Sericytochromatia bacterium]|nr:hypothetical protein [Candidatus Tanganyikabacteria bacterium]